MARELLTEYLELFRRNAADTACAYPRGYRHARWTYGRVLDAATRFARELAAREVEPGERILLWGENSAEWVAAFWGAALRGAVVVPMDRIAAPEFVRRVARETRARLAVVSRELAPALATPTLVLEDLEDEIARHSAASLPPPPVRRSDPVEIIFTSGTTAEPRGVVLNHGNILANLEPLEREIAPYRKYLVLVHPLRFLNVVPLSHVFGQFMGLFIPPLLRGLVFFPATLNPAEAIRTIKSERISVLVTVPRLLESLREKIERDVEAEGRTEKFRRDFAGAEGRHFLLRWWRFRRIRRRFGWKFWAMVCGGATLPADAEEFWTRLGYAVIQGYGLTETTSLISVNHPFKLGRGSIGKVLPGREIRLDESGEILVRGEGIAAGYWSDERLEPVAGEDGWFRTGDIGELGPDGYLYFKGRKKNVIVTAQGMNVYPQDVEAALRAQPEIRDAVVFGLTRDGNSEPCAAILLRPGESDAAAETAVRRANESLADYQRLRRWFLWPEEDFPRTATEKPRLSEIQRVAAERLGTAPAGAPPGSSPLGELIARITGRAPARLADDARLAADLDLDSIQRVELLAALEERYQVELDESRFSDATTVGELHQMLRGRPAGPRTEVVFPRWAMRWPVRWLRAAAYYPLAWLPALVLGWPRVAGREHLRAVRGPALFVANHVTWLDAGLILAALPARFRHRLAIAMGGERLARMRRPPREENFFARRWDRAGYFAAVGLFNAFPLPRFSGFRESFAYAGELADRGQSLLVFPEGELTKDGSVMPFQSGVGLLATNLRLPVVPVRLDGLWELAQRGAWFAPPGRIRVTFGEPVTYPSDADAEEIAGDLRRRIIALAE
jgi:long-chain acyl-CoA synthetase